MEPLDPEVLEVEADVLDPAIGLEPVDALPHPAPEALRVLDGLLVQPLVVVVLDAGLGGERRGYLVQFGHARLLP